MKQLRSLIKLLLYIFAFLSAVNFIYWISETIPTKYSYAVVVNGHIYISTNVWVDPEMTEYQIETINGEMTSLYNKSGYYTWRNNIGKSIFINGYPLFKIKGVPAFKGLAIKHGNGTIYYIREAGKFRFTF